MLSQMYRFHRHRNCMDGYMVTLNILVRPSFKCFRQYCSGFWFVEQLVLPQMYAHRRSDGVDCDILILYILVRLSIWTYVTSFVSAFGLWISTGSPYFQFRTLAVEGPMAN